MKNLSKRFILMTAFFIAASFLANAQSSNTTVKSGDAQSSAVAEKFFNIQVLDNLKTNMDAAYTTFEQAATEKKQDSQTEFLKARRLYVVELEKQMSAYDKTSETGKKIRSELKRTNTIQ